MSVSSSVIRLAPSASKRIRRSHAERTAETRAKVIAAVIEAIADVGFQRTTAQVIAHRAGVTWGAVQHHFGGKDELLLAVLEDTFTRFAERLADIQPKKLPLAERVSQFVDRSWDHFRSRHFRSTFEILLNYLGREDHRDAGEWRTQMGRAWDHVWSEIFYDIRLPRQQSLVLQHLTIATLSGLAATLMMEGSAGTELPRKQLELVKRTLLRELRQRPH